MAMTPSPIREMTFGWYMIYDTAMTGREKHPYVIANQSIIIQGEKWYPAFQISSEDHGHSLPVSINEIPVTERIFGINCKTFFIRFDYNYLVHKNFFDKNGVCIYIGSVNTCINISIFQQIPSPLPFPDALTTYLYLTLDGKFNFKPCTTLDLTPPTIPVATQPSFSAADFPSLTKGGKK